MTENTNPNSVALGGVVAKVAVAPAATKPSRNAPIVTNQTILGDIMSRSNKKNVWTTEVRLQILLFELYILEHDALYTHSDTHTTSLTLSIEYG